MNDTLNITYAAPLGKSTLTITLLTLVLLIGLSTLFYYVGSRQTGWQQKLYWIVASNMVVIVLASFLCKIRHYELTGQQLNIRYGFWNRQIALTNVVSAQTQAGALQDSFRTFGNGGMWSFLGKFSSPSLGPLRVYISDPKRTIVITLQDDAPKVLISPEDTEAFLAELNKRRGEGV